MIEFIPRDIGRWRGVFDFSPQSITLECKENKRTKFFDNKQELIEFLKEHGIILTDPDFPLQFIGPEDHHVFGSCYAIVQWTLQGWYREVYK